MEDKYKYPVIGGGVLPTGYYSNFNREKCITIARAGSAGHVNWQSNKFWATDVCFTAVEKDESLKIKFVYYYLKNKERDLQKHLYGASMPKLDKNYLWNYLIPIPPIEIQKDIVKKLDIMDKLINDISEGLPAEIEKRQKQYEYYREKLLTFKKKKLN